MSTTSEVPDCPTEPSVIHEVEESSETRDASPSSGVSTPTATWKGRPFLGVGLAPLAGIFRGRYPSSSTSGMSNGDAHDSPKEEDEEEDRRTLRAVKLSDEEPVADHVEKTGSGGRTRQTEVVLVR